MNRTAVKITQSPTTTTAARRLVRSPSAASSAAQPPREHHGGDPIAGGDRYRDVTPDRNPRKGSIVTRTSRPARPVPESSRAPRDGQQRRDRRDVAPLRLRADGQAGDVIQRRGEPGGSSRLPPVVSSGLRQFASATASTGRRRLPTS